MRIFKFSILPIFLGCIAIALVYLGEAGGWEDFSSRTGYFGTHWFDSALYAMGNPDARNVVAFLWFFYVFTTTLVVELIVYEIWRHERSR
jgi:hypothetical protein